MKEQNFTTTLLVGQTPHEVFAAINNVSSWWHGEIEGPTQALNDEFSYRMKEFHYSKQLVTELVPGKKVEWLVTDSKLNFTQKPDEWTGTKIRFDISETGGKTQLTFTHEGLTPAFECYGDCSNGWSMLIHESLLSLLDTGVGKEVF
jgi:hypothetical protein